MNISISQTDITRYRNNEDIIRETAEQVIKDFGTYGIEIIFPSTIKWAYKELFEQLERHISELLSTNNKMLLSLLYTIDLSENMIRINSQKNPDKDLSEIVTELILERELKKVILRNYFKQAGI